MGRRARFCRHLRLAIRHINAAIRHLKCARELSCSGTVRALLGANIHVLRAVKADKRRLGRSRCKTGSCGCGCARPL